MNLRSLLPVLLLLIYSPVVGQDHSDKMKNNSKDASLLPNESPLWNDGAPGAMGSSAKDTPTLIAFPVSGKLDSHVAVIICPGGGYGNLAMDHEGRQIARWLNESGINAFVCNYRHRRKGYGHPAPLQDVQRAIRTVRHDAKRWSVDPERIGVLGFSAGGHLASSAATLFDDGDLAGTDPIDQASSRPDFAILCYPVIAMGQSFTHRGSQKNLLGKDASPELIARMSTETQVTANTPPTFLWHTSEDKVVPPENSIVFYRALQAAGVPAELHLYAKGGHGMGLAVGKPGASEWPDACLSWLRAIQVLR